MKVVKETLLKIQYLAMIGPDWLDVRDEHGDRRLDNPNFVRIEIATALRRNTPIPILVEGAKVPEADQAAEGP
jgi:hypothetical protein